MSLFQTVLFGQDLRQTGEFSDLAEIEGNFIRFVNEQLSRNFNCVEQCLQEMFRGAIDYVKYQRSSQADKKLAIMLFSVLVPLRNGFFPIGFTGQTLNKMGVLVVNVLSLFKKNPNEKKQGHSDISGEKLSIFLRNCYSRIHDSKVKHAQQCQQYEVRIRELEQKVYELRNRYNIVDEDKTGYNISFRSTQIPQPQNPLQSIPLVTSEYGGPQTRQNNSNSCSSSSKSLESSATSFQPSLLLNVVFGTLLLALILYTLF